MRKIVLTYGLIAGVMLSAMMLITLPFQDRIGFETGAVIGYTTMVLAFLMVFFGVRTYRDNVVKGAISFGHAFKAGLLIMLVASACYVATWELIYHKLAPDFADKFAAHAIEKATRSGASAAEIAERTRQMERYKELYRNPLINIAMTLLEPMPVGLVFTLMTAGILSRKRRPPAGVVVPAEG